MWEIPTQNDLNAIIYIFWGIVFIYKIVCLETKVYYEKESDDTFTKFMSFVKYLESWEPWIFLGPNMWKRSKSTNNWFYYKITKNNWKYKIHVIEKSFFKYVFHKVLINNYKWIFYMVIKKKLLFCPILSNFVSYCLWYFPRSTYYLFIFTH